MTEAIYNVPTRKEIETLVVGDMALDCFGKLAEVVEITCRKEALNGKLFVHYYTYSSPTSRISMGQKQDTLTRTVGLSNRHKSAELDSIEAKILSERGVA